MQSPTPPTKPTPPTPPSMKTSSSANTHAPAKPAPQSIDSPKTVAATPSADQQPTPAANNIPPLGSFNTTKETTSETAMPIAANVQKTTPASMGFSFFFVIIFFIAMAIVAVYWWKNHKPRQQSRIDYSTESSDEIVNLIFSQNSPEAAPPPAPKPLPKKIVTTAKPPQKKSSNFEVRV